MKAFKLEIWLCVHESVPVTAQFPFPLRDDICSRQDCKADNDIYIIIIGILSLDSCHISCLQKLHICCSIFFFSLISSFMPKPMSLYGNIYEADYFLELTFLEVQAAQFHTANLHLAFFSSFRIHFWRKSSYLLGNCSTIITDCSIQTIECREYHVIFCLLQVYFSSLQNY